MIDFIEKYCYLHLGKYANKNIILNDWEKEIINLIYSNDSEHTINNDIKKIWFISPRKTGTTTFCKILHYFRKPLTSYLLSYNMYWSEHINRNPLFTFEYKFCKDCSRSHGVNFQIPISYRNAINKIENNKVLDFIIENNDINMIETNIKDFDLMMDCDRTIFPNSLYYTLKTFNPKFWTISINLDTYNNNEEIQRLIKEDEGKAIICFINEDGSYKINK